MNDNSIISVHGLPAGYTIAPVQLTPEMKIAMRRAIEAGMTVSQIWEETMEVAPKFTIIPSVI